MKKVVFAMLFLTTPAVARQGNDDHRQPLYGNLGPHNRTITTSSHMAQAYFSEGLQFMYAFGPSSALLSFRAAQSQGEGSVRRNSQGKGPFRASRE